MLWLGSISDALAPSGTQAEPRPAPDLHAAASSGVAASIAGCCAHSERGLTGQHGRQRGRPRSDWSRFDARSLTSVRTRRRPLANLPLFFLQIGRNVRARTLTIPPWNAFTLLTARVSLPVMCSQTVYIDFA